MEFGRRRSNATFDRRWFTAIRSILGDGTEPSFQPNDQIGSGPIKEIDLFLGKKQHNGSILALIWG